MYTVLRGGYNAKLPKNFLQSRPNGIDSYLFLIIKSPAKFEIDKKKYIVKTNSFLIIRPHTPYQYSGLDNEYKNDWLHFLSSDDGFEDCYNHIFNHPIATNNSLQFTQYFQHILWENNYSFEEYRQQNVTMLIQTVLNKLLQEEKIARTASSYNPYSLKLQELRLNMLSKPYINFTPSELAKSLNISTSYFQHMYKDFWGIPFKTDLINMRLDYARELILETNLPLEKIAIMSGYSTEIHFYRQFKAKTGMTPREYQISMKS